MARIRFQIKGGQISREVKQPESKGMRREERHQMFPRLYFLILFTVNETHSFILPLRLLLALFIFF